MKVIISAEPTGTHSASTDYFPQTLPTMFPLLSLNQTNMIFLPGSSKYPASVVQVTLATRDKVASIEIIARYYFSQHQISVLFDAFQHAIFELLFRDRERPLPSSLVVMKGDGYRMTAEHKEWKLGPRWEFNCGDERIEPAKDKWRFIFETLSCEE